MAFDFVDVKNTTSILLMRGCSGLFALVFVVLVGILVFRVNNSYFKDKANKNSFKH